MMYTSLIDLHRSYRVQPHGRVLMDLRRHANITLYSLDHGGPVAKHASRFTGLELWPVAIEVQPPLNSDQILAQSLLF